MRRLRVRSWSPPRARTRLECSPHYTGCEVWKIALNRHFGWHLLVLFNIIYLPPACLWHFNSLTRDWTWGPCSGSAESQLMDHQGRSGYRLFYIHLFSIKVVTFASYEIVVVHSLICVWLFATPWTAARQASLSFPVHLLELAQIHVHWVSDAIQPSLPLSSPSPPAFNLSQHQGLF